MNTAQIKQHLKGYKGFIGVFPSDRLPHLKGGQAMIVNTDPHDEPGQHWVAFYMSEDLTLEYFDSFGMPPLVPDFRKYINRGAHVKFSYSTVQLQHDNSETCGKHCITFVKHRLSSISFFELLAHFTRSHRDNDRQVDIAIV